MLDVKFIRENLDIVKAAIANKNKKDIDIDRALVLAEERRELSLKITELNRQKNVAAQSRDIEAGTRIKNESREVEDKHAAVEKELVSILIKIPNIPSPDTPVGADESGNKVIRSWGEKPVFTFTPKAHWDLGPELGIINTQKAANISGARFSYLMGPLARLQFGLIQYVFSTLSDSSILNQIASQAGLSIDAKAFVPVIPPCLLYTSDAADE